MRVTRLGLKVAWQKTRPCWMLAACTLGCSVILFKGGYPDAGTTVLLCSFLQALIALGAFLYILP